MWPMNQLFWRRIAFVLAMLVLVILDPQAELDVGSLLNWSIRNETLHGIQEDPEAGPLGPSP